MNFDTATYLFGDNTEEVIQLECTGVSIPQKGRKHSCLQIVRRDRYNHFSTYLFLEETKSKQSDRGRSRILILWVQPLCS